MVIKSLFVLHAIGKDLFLPFGNLNNISISTPAFALASVSASAFKYKHLSKHLSVSKSLKFVFAAYLLVCFLSLKESTCEKRNSVFYSLQYLR